MTEELELLLEAARKAKMSQDQAEQQRRSFAYGNTNIENPRITKQTVNEEAEKLERE